MIQTHSPDKTIQPGTVEISRRGLLAGITGGLSVAALTACYAERPQDGTEAREGVESRAELEERAAALRREAEEGQWLFADQLKDDLTGEVGQLTERVFHAQEVHHNEAERPHLNMRLSVALEENTASVHLMLELHETDDPRCEVGVFQGPTTEWMESSWTLTDNEVLNKLEAGTMAWSGLYEYIRSLRPNRIKAVLPTGEGRETAVTIAGVDGTSVEIVGTDDVPSETGVELTPKLLDEAESVVGQVVVNITSRTDYR